MKKKPARKSTIQKTAKRVDIDVDDFDDPFTHATNTAALLLELAEAKGNGDTHSAERRFWWAIASMASGLLDNLEQMDTEYTGAANYIFNLENGRCPGKGERRPGGAA